MSKQLLRIDLMVMIMELWFGSSLPLAGIQNWPLLTVSADIDFMYATSSHEQSATVNKCNISLMTVTYCCKSSARAQSQREPQKRTHEGQNRKSYNETVPT
ncbi:hypothetical protein M758_UG168000 [Ceratodon purpureus]|nr:hypothetical protein M758_UG168000 [Ceratodon purpureus]